jgi:flagellar motility protein MotE (MotC chaperone)
MSVEDSVDASRWLESEKAALTERENDLATRERELKLLDKKVSQKLLTLDQAKTARVNSLAKLYDDMDARSVAALMANLDDNTVVLILPRMKTKNASQVLALFPPKRGAMLSKQMITIAEN